MVNSFAISIACIGWQTLPLPQTLSNVEWWLIIIIICSIERCDWSFSFTLHIKIRRVTMLGAIFYLGIHKVDMNNDNKSNNNIALYLQFHFHSFHLFWFLILCAYYFSQNQQNFCNECEWWFISIISLLLLKMLCWCFCESSMLDRMIHVIYRYRI